MPPDPAPRGSGRGPLVRADLVRIAEWLGVLPQVVEKDYLLSYVLAGIADTPQLAGLRFKGGTALKKVYFGDYRFSEDLDFSAIDVPKGLDLEAVVALAIRSAERRLLERGRFRVEFDRPPEREPHLKGQDAFRVRVAFPWQNAPIVRVKIEITHDGSILLKTPSLPIMHGYDDLGEPMNDVWITTYAMEEIVAEKLRALLQTQLRLEARGWTRPRSRDYYDLWRLLSERSDQIDRASVRLILPGKLAHRGVTFEGIEDFFKPQLVAEARIHWESSLGTFVSGLPSFAAVLSPLESWFACS